MKTYNWEGVNPDGYFLDKLEPIPSLYRLSRNCSKYRQQLYQYHEKYQPHQDRKSGSAGMPRPISYAVFCLKKKKKDIVLRATYFKSTAQSQTPSRIDNEVRISTSII